jgi:MraZ protein
LDETSKSRVGDHPRAIFPAKVDDKGRLKLPADLQRYLVGIDASKVFITTLDRHMGRIYPIAVWNEVQAALYADNEDPDAADDLLFNARVYGDDAELDAQGRLAVPAALRKELGLDNEQVWLEHYRGHLRLFGREIFEERNRRASEDPVGKAKKFDKRGLP